jgi:hypothetical protein
MQIQKKILMQNVIYYYLIKLKVRKTETKRKMNIKK